MDIRPILSAMLRNPTGAVLVALQVAITLAALCNAGFIVEQRLERMDRPTGYDHDNVVTAQVVGMDPYSLTGARVAEDLRALRAMPGVIAASATPQVPLSGGGFGWGYRRSAEPEDPRRAQTSMVLVDEQSLDAYGLRLVAGRWFQPEEIGSVSGFQQLSAFKADGIVISRAMADAMFPEGNALGQPIYDAFGAMTTIIGIVERAQGYFLHSDTAENTAFLPALLTDGGLQSYVIRTEPGRSAEVQRDVEAVLLAANPRRMVREVRTLADVRDETYRNDHAMAVTLLAVMGLLVAVTILGLFGLTSFNVSRRRKQIGTRRALGARRGDILRHFLVESWIVTTAGAVVGVGLAVALSVWLVHEFELPKLDWRYVPVGIIALWVIGQLATVGPARRAAATEPAIATRSA
jgi:putative ABC transport system permease protein